MRRYKFIALVCSIATAWPLSTVAGDITRVTVLNAELQSIRTLTSVPDLAVFSELWATRVKANVSTAMRPGYSIVIQQSDRRSERWLYDDTGIVQVLSIRKTPVYRLYRRWSSMKSLGSEPLNTRRIPAYTADTINTTKGGDPVSFTKRCHLAGIAR
jgi:hypothetical protein